MKIITKPIQSVTLLLASLGLGLLTDTLIRQQIFGLNFFVWTIVWVTILLFTSLSKKKLSYQPFVYATLAVANAFLVYFRGEGIVQFWSFCICMAGISLLFSYVYIDNFRQLPLLGRALEYVAGAFISFFNAVSQVSESFKSTKKREKSWVATRINPAIIVSTILVLVFIALFASSDIVFKNSFSWIDNAFLKILSPFDGLNVGNTITIGFWTVLSFAWLSMATLRTKAQSTKNDLSFKQFVKPRDVKFILVPLVAVFAIFALIQANYLFAGNALPDGVTYAEYARSGYWELLFATILASSVVYVLHAANTDKQDRTSKLLSIGLLMLNLIVVASAWKRLSLYQSAFGWTITRFVAYMGLLCIFSGIVFLGIWLFNKLTTKQLYASAWYSLTVVLTVAALLNPAGIIATRNIADRSEREAPLDSSYIVRSLSSDAHPAICKHASSLKEDYRNEYELLKDTFAHSNSVLSRSGRVNDGLSAHHTNSYKYILKYRDCL